MKCNECGKNFVLLANHVIKKHGIAPDDYRRKYNIPLTQALADDELRNHLSSKALIRAQTNEGIDHIRRMQSTCDRQKQTGKKRDLPECSVRHCHEKNDKKRLSFLADKLPGILPDWIDGMSNRDISLKHGIAFPTLRKWVRDGHLPKRHMRYEVPNVK